MFKNPLKEKLAAGKAVWGVVAADPSPPVLEVLGYVGFDWVLLDNEHGHITADSMPNCVRACEATGMVPIVRPIGNKPEIIRPFMDMGCYGVQVPQVDTPEEAKAAVDAVKYPPLGVRGFSSGVRNNRFGMGMPSGEYLEHANRETLVCLMVETPEGIKNAEAIARVEGVDVVFVGAGDLSVLMGVPGQNTHPDVIKAVEGAVEGILRAGKTAGCSGPDDQIPHWLEKGVRFFHSSVTRLLIGSGRDYLSMANAAEKKVGAS
ncbi:MAG: aldolase/citrate lyase family protein [Dehalococcoidia bacterium]